ncbi:MAG: hypothetical protein PHY85_04085, partial [Bacteroidales bacterium]|nr:hypothetical protein [Bacteroidales bacterium]
MDEYLIYAGGSFIRTENRLEVSCSFDNSVFAFTYLASKEDIEYSILMAQKASEELKKMPSYRLEQILNE